MNATIMPHHGLVSANVTPERADYVFSDCIGRQAFLKDNFHGENLRMPFADIAAKSGVNVTTDARNRPVVVVIRN